MKLLVVGASGLVGGNLLRVAREAGHEAIGTYATFPLEGLRPLLLEGDLRAATHLLSEFAPDVVACCSSWSRVDGCQGDPSRAFRENAELPAALARLAFARGAQFLYFSTSYVFDGTRGPYDESAPVCPISVYGESKWRGEQLIAQATHGSALIARTMGVYGDEPQQKNFVYQVVRNLRAGREMTVPLDQLGNATHAVDLAAVSLELLHQKQSGIWNVAGPDPNLSRRDFALRIAKAYHLDPALFRFSTTKELNQPAPRPLHAGLIIDRVRKAANLRLREWFPVAVEQ